MDREKWDGHERGGCTAGQGETRRALNFRLSKDLTWRTMGETMKGFKQGGEMIKYAATLRCSQVGTLIFFLKNPSYSRASGGYIFRGDWAPS